MAPGDVPKSEAVKAGYGIFWMLREDGSVGHTGGDPGTTTFIFLKPLTNTGTIFFTDYPLRATEHTPSMGEFSDAWDALVGYAQTAR